MKEREIVSLVMLVAMRPSPSLKDFERDHLFEQAQSWADAWLKRQTVNLPPSGQERPKEK